MNCNTIYSKNDAALAVAPIHLEACPIVPLIKLPSFGLVFVGPFFMGLQACKSIPHRHKAQMFPHTAKGCDCPIRNSDNSLHVK